MNEDLGPQNDTLVIAPPTPDKQGKNRRNFWIAAIAVIVIGGGAFALRPTPEVNTPPSTSPPQPSVTISKGAAYNNPACTGSSCAYIHVAASNGAGGRYTCSVDPGSPAAAGSGYFTNSLGNVIYGNVGVNSSNEYFFLGYPGTVIHCTVNGVDSNQMTW